MKLNAYAKINLTLDILGVREDGFHELRSVMVPISLCDVIELEKSDRLSFDCDKSELVTDDNLCTMAARLFFEEIGKEACVSIRLQKNIPYPAGLGGGSADAACILNGLNEAYGFPLEREKLFAIAARLGSDVPFCLLCSPADCKGRGERLSAISGMPSLDIVIAIGKARLRTPDVFRAYDASGEQPRNDSERLLSAVEGGDKNEIIASLGNAFEPITDKLAPETMQIRALMTDSGALASHLSGSGPSVYGIYENSEKASASAEMLREKGFFAVCCKTFGS